MGSNAEERVKPPRKRLRMDDWERPASRGRTSDEQYSEANSLSRSHSSHYEGEHLRNKDKQISISSSQNALHASQSTTPYLMQHIPGQYNALGSEEKSLKIRQHISNPNSKFCYRHRPDLKCRRQADVEASTQMQKDLDKLSDPDRQGVVQFWSLFSAAPPKHRKIMLQGILQSCCFPQLSYLSANIGDMIRLDPTNTLPSEIMTKIFCFLDPTSLCKAAQVSRSWRQLADHDSVWRRMCAQHIDRKCTRCGWGLPLMESKRLRLAQQQFEQNISNTTIGDTRVLSPANETLETASATSEYGSQNVNSDADRTSDHQSYHEMPRATLPSQPEKEHLARYRPWKDVYKDRFRIGTNWKHGRHSLKVLKGHSNGVMALQMLDDTLATGSYDSTIKIWDLRTGKELRTLRGHASGIRTLQFDDTKLISGSLDKTLKVWNWKTGECLATYNGHTDGIISLHFDANYIVSGSIDKTARIWNIRDRSVCSLRGHTDWVNCVRIDTKSRTVLTASDDCTIKLWNLDTKQCIMTYTGHVGQVQQVLPMPADFEIDEEELSKEAGSISDPGSPCSYDEQTPAASRHQTPNTQISGQSQSQVSSNASLTTNPLFTNTSRPLPPRYMVTSALDSTIRMWDVWSGRCVQTFFGHVEGVWAIGADSLRIVSGAEDTMVKVWDPRSGKCELTFTGHAGPVACIGLSDSTMCTGGEDGEVRVYNFQS